MYTMYTFHFRLVQNLHGLSLETKMLTEQHFHFWRHHFRGKNEHVYIFVWYKIYAFFCRQNGDGRQHFHIWPSAFSCLNFYGKTCRFCTKRKCKRIHFGGKTKMKQDCRQFHDSKYLRFWQLSVKHHVWYWIIANTDRIVAVGNQEASRVKIDLTLTKKEHGSIGKPSGGKG